MADLPMADRHETVLPPPPDDAREALAGALAADADTQLTALSAVVADHPTLVAGGPSSPPADANRSSATPTPGSATTAASTRCAPHGWGGRGFVRWSQPARTGRS